jgi:glycosyltransferase involved in cell wall biosynthesis
MAAPDGSEVRAPASRTEADPVAVSVVIPCFNSSAFVAETVGSVLSQTMREFEIVFVDDGSEDDTRSVIDAIIAAHRDVPMRALSQQNAGTAAARNRGIDAARGHYILPLDADDLIAPTMLEECAAVLDTQPEIDLVYTDREDFGDVEAVSAAGTYAVERLKYFNQLGYCTLYRRSIWDAVGGYRANVSGFDDWDFWLATALRGYQGSHLPKPLFKHRRRATSLLWRLLPDFERLHAQIVLNNRDAYSDAEIRMAQRFLDHGEPATMLRSARFVFLARYYQGYPGHPVASEASCG